MAAVGMMDIQYGSSNSQAIIYLDNMIAMTLSLPMTLSMLDAEHNVAEDCFAECLCAHFNYTAYTLYLAFVSCVTFDISRCPAIIPDTL